MTKREAEQLRRDLETGQRAFDRHIQDETKSKIVEALHAEQVEVIADRAHTAWVHLLEQFSEEGDDAAKAINQWVRGGRLTRAPEFLYNELEWGDSLFWAAAQARVSHEAGLALRSMGPERAAAWLTQQLINISGPGQSSSTSHNLMYHLTAKAYAKALETMRWFG